MYSIVSFQMSQSSTALRLSRTHDSHADFWHSFVEACPFFPEPCSKEYNKALKHFFKLLTAYTDNVSELQTRTIIKIKRVHEDGDMRLHDEGKRIVLKSKR